MPSGFYTKKLGSIKWSLPSRYKDLRMIGHGTYGSVCAATDCGSNCHRQVAIKKLARPFHSDEHAKRTYREIRMLQHMHHDNLLELLDAFTPDSSFNEFQSVYLATPLMDTSLHEVLKHQVLPDDTVRFLAYQILRGLKYLHSANIVHRDIKPQNLGVCSNCDLRILDFGMARQRNSEMTGYVATRWYRAPEIMLQWMHYDFSADLWSVGCVLAEMIEGRPLMPGSDTIDQLLKILRVTGMPDANFMRTRISSPEAALFLETQRDRVRRRPLSDLCPRADSGALDLLGRLLQLDPSDRITAEQALAHPYMAKYHDIDDEPDAQPFTDSVEDSQLSLDEWRRLVWDIVSKR